MYRPFAIATFLAILAHLVQARIAETDNGLRKKAGDPSGTDKACDTPDVDKERQSSQDGNACGKHDDQLRNMKPHRAQTPKGERVYPATAEAQAEKARAETAKEPPRFESYEERMRRAMPASQVKELAGLVQYIRPGVYADDIDALAAVSDGLLTAERLSETGYWAPDQMPCQIVRARGGKHPGRVLIVRFPAKYHDPENVRKHASPGALLAAVDGAKPAFADLTEHSRVRRIDLPANEADLVARIHFKDGVFTETEYSTRGHFENIDKVREEFEERDWKKAVASFVNSHEEAKLTLEEMLARCRAPYRDAEARGGADEALRAWAEGYSAWGESANRWQSFVNWLITQSTPDSRHSLAEGWNWDHGTEVLRWIIRQADTDIATVATIIWRAEPSYHIAEIAKGAHGYANKIGLDVCDLLIETSDKLQAGFYEPRDGHDPIAFPQPGRLTLDCQSDALVRARDRVLPEIVRNPIAGRSLSDLTQRVPVQYSEILM